MKQLLLAIAFAFHAHALTVDQLRCENRTDPLGIASDKPRLSWILDSGHQAAYQVVVEGAWDSGKVASDQSTGVEYAGQPLKPRKRYPWKVRVWNKDGEASGWSRPATFATGLGAWKAEWIGYDKPRAPEEHPADLDGAKWIWHAPDPAPAATECHRLFVRTFALPANVAVARADLVVASDNTAKVVLNTRQVATVRSWQDPVKLDVRKQIKAGDNHLRVEVKNEDGPAGLIAKLVVTTAAGETFACSTDASWKSSDTPGANWHDRAIDANGWPGAREIGDHGVAPWGQLAVKGLDLPPPACLRTEFAADKPVKAATLYATGLGIFDVSLNGRRVTDDWFNPGWTDYTKRVYYRTYDVTPLVRSGANVLGATLADGWFSGYVGYGRKRDHYGKRPRLKAELHLEYADGSTAVVATGPSWKGANGPILSADFLHGEIHDARIEPRDWQPVSTGAEVNPALAPHPGPPVVAVREFPAKTIAEPVPGTYVLDLGQNIAGVARLKIAGQPGQTITLRYAERLNPDGTIYTENLRAARCTDTYICRGEGVEEWTPRFTFHGFQYIEVQGLKERPAPDAVTGIALSSDTPVAGSFECSDPMLNQLHSNIYWTQRSNFIDIPTDCPQRDERLGWTGDAQIYIRTAALNCDVQAFFAKWLVDLEDGQRADGQFPCVAPVKVAGADGGPAWADAGVICPWTIYEVYGDRRALERHYGAMTRFIAFCENRSTPDLLPPEKFHSFGDWLSIGADTPKDVIYSAYFAYSTKLVARAAAVLGKADDAAKYEALFGRIKASFNKAYVGADGRIKGDTQCAYVMAIAFDLVEGGKLRQAGEHLVADIEKRGGHLSTGFIGTKDLMLALAKVGRNDVAYRLIHNDTFPSWGFSIKHGATSIWERWNGWTPEKGFGDPGMNSFAHYSFGAVYQWMVENIGGIRAEAPGYKEIRIQPDPGDLAWAKVSYDSVYGRISSHWKRDGAQLAMEVTIPANTTATVVLPGEKPRRLGPGTHRLSGTTAP